MTHRFFSYLSVNILIFGALLLSAPAMAQTCSPPPECSATQKLNFKGGVFVCEEMATGGNSSGGNITFTDCFTSPSISQSNTVDPSSGYVAVGYYSNGGDFGGGDKLYFCKITLN